MILSRKGLTRREFMELTAVGTGAIILGDFPEVRATTPKRGGALTCGIVRMKRTMDPHRRYGGYNQSVQSIVWEGLVENLSVYDRQKIAQEKGPDAVPLVKPMLADAWEIEKGGTRYVFHLKKGVKFHNGKELEAGDVKWSWDRIKNPKHRAVAREYLTPRYKSAETPDRYTVVANLSGPWSPFLPACASYSCAIAPKDSIPEGVVWNETPTFKPPSIAPPGTGPFIPVEYNARTGGTFKRFDGYRIPGLPYLDKIVYKVIPKDNPRTMALRAGNVDYILEPDIPWLVKHVDESKVYTPVPLKEDKVTIYPFYGIGVECLGLNCHPESKSPFKDVRVRRALMISIDRKVLAETVFGKAGIPMIQAHHWSNSPFGFKDIPIPERNIDEAKALLKEAGYPNGLDVEFTINPPRARIEQTAQVIQQMIRPAGFRMKIRPIKGAQYGQTLRKYKYEISRLNFTKHDPMSSYGNKLHTNDRFKGYAIYTGVRDELIDKWLDECSSISDLKKRKELVKKVAMRNIEMAYNVPHFMYLMATAWTDRVKNLQPWKYFEFGERAFIETWVDG